MLALDEAHLFEKANDDIEQLRGVSRQHRWLANCQRHP